NTLLMLLPDVNESRMFWRFQALQVRHLVARKAYDEAIQAAQVGFAMARHIEQAPFVVHDLVAISCANQMLTQLTAMIEQPDSPNLYWALTSLPSPLVDVRESVELELDMLELSFPDATRLDRLRGDEWTRLLDQLLEAQHNYGSDLGLPNNPREKATYLVECHAKAMRYFVKHEVYSASQLEEMRLEELLVRWMLHPHAVVRDDLLKWTFSSYPSTERWQANDEAAWKFDPDRSQLAERLYAGRLGVLGADVRLQQRLDILRVVEALRMYAAAHDRKLPSQLEDLANVPVPVDPLTGTPFLYDLTPSGSAHLRSRAPSEYSPDYLLHIRPTRDAGSEE
ncbi:MAG: hypothetical protein KDB23_19610, partial [Planctomycetales bacterium]|nr:hypothetical protein [Planctomycetales bacterium]